MITLDREHVACPVVAAMSPRQDTVASFERPLSSLEFEFDVRLLPLGAGTFLHLWEKPRVVLNTDTWKLIIEGWGVTLEPTEANSIPRELCRQFQRLWRKAQQGILNEQETVIWSAIVDRVDVAQYASDHESPRYMEAELLERSRETRVRFHDGKLARIPTSATSSLSLVDKGEWFGAYVKFDRDGNIVSLERPSLIGALPSEEEIGGWPPPVSG